MPWHRTAGALGLLLAACEPEPDDPPVVNPCRVVCPDEEGTQIQVELPWDRLGEPVTVELNPCIEEGLLPDGAPVVVVLSGGFEALVSPVELNDRAVEAQHGIVALYPSFPIEDGDFLFERVGDFRGSGARWATEATLHYAAGQLADLEGCTLADRIPAPLSGQAPWLHGQSNGGNLAVAMLADPELDLPEVAGITTFETPAGAQFVTLEVGSAQDPLPLYQPESCTWTEEDGLTCPLDYSSLGWAEDAVHAAGHRGVAYFDLDGSGAYEERVDAEMWGIRPEVDGEGIEPDGLLTIAEAEAFWALRDASRALSAAVERYPDTPYILLGTETDHNLGIEDHAHITGLAHALREAGARWVRVNPDASYLELMTGTKDGWVDNPANTATWPGDPSVVMLPNAAEVGLHSRSYVTAALVELMQRRWRDNWDDDLQGWLLP
jgi:hypothetical protein